MRPILYSLLCSLVFICASCQQETCHQLGGTWVNNEGQKLIFENTSGDEAPEKAALVTYFGVSASDTFFANVRYRCDRSPGVLDLLIDTLKTKTIKHHLLGLISWSNDSVFSLHQAKGREEPDRPQLFDLNESSKFVREQ
jgi:hypothetical protein